LSHPETLQDTPIGVFRDIHRPSYDRLVQEQITTAQESGTGDLASLLAGKDTWQV
jgi:2-oxoglutarate ferredoxin oxidoreductase subunit beta